MTWSVPFSYRGDAEVRRVSDKNFRSLENWMKTNAGYYDSSGVFIVKNGKITIDTNSDMALLNLKGAGAGKYYSSRIQYANYEAGFQWQLGMRGSLEGQHDYLIEYYNGSSWIYWMRFDVDSADGRMTTFGRHKIFAESGISPGIWLADTVGNLKTFIGLNAVDSSDFRVYIGSNRFLINTTNAYFYVPLNMNGNNILSIANTNWTNGSYSVYANVEADGRWRVWKAGTELFNVDWNGVLTAATGMVGPYYNAFGTDPFIQIYDNAVVWYRLTAGPGGGTILRASSNTTGTVFDLSHDGNFYMNRLVYSATGDFQFGALPTYNNANGSMRWMGTNTMMGQSHTSSSLAYKRNLASIRTHPEMGETSVFDRLDPMWFQYQDDHPFRDRWKGRRPKPERADELAELMRSPDVVDRPTQDDDEWYEDVDYFESENPPVGRMGFSYEQVKQEAPHWTYIADGMEAVSYEGMLPDFTAWTVASVHSLRSDVQALKAKVESLSQT